MALDQFTQLARAIDPGYNPERNPLILEWAEVLPEEDRLNHCMAWACPSTAETPFRIVFWRAWFAFKERDGRLAPGDCFGNNLMRRLFIHEYVHHVDALRNACSRGPNGQSHRMSFWAVLDIALERARSAEIPIMPSGLRHEVTTVTYAHIRRQAPHLRDEPGVKPADSRTERERADAVHWFDWFSGVALGQIMQFLDGARDEHPPDAPQAGQLGVHPMTGDTWQLLVDTPIHRGRRCSGSRSADELDFRRRSLP